MRFSVLLAGLIVCAGFVENQGKLHYKTRDGWKSIGVHEYAPFFHRSSGGVRVEIATGYAGSDRVSAILVHFDKCREHKDLIAYHAETNIGLISWDRWNSEALNLSLPDSDEMLVRHGFDCKAIDVVRLLRVVR